MGLTVVVTGPTGDIGISAVEALERLGEVDRIIGMARRPFDPADHGWTRTEYRQGDILDRGAVDALVADADVVIHLAFIIMGSREESARVNLEGTRNVFEATAAAEPAEAAGVHLIGRGVRLSLGQPDADHRGRAHQRVRPSTTTPSRRPHASPLSSRSRPTRRSRCSCCGPCIVAGPEGAHAGRVDAVAPATRAGATCRPDAAVVEATVP